MAWVSLMSQYIPRTSISAALDGSVTLGFPFCETIMADAFPEIPILIGTWTEDQWEGFSDIDSAFLLLNLLLHMKGNDLAKEKIMAP